MVRCFRKFAVVKDLSMNINNMIYKVLILILLINTGFFAQNTVLFKTPPGNLTLPSVIQEENGVPKSSGIGIIESKWVHSSSQNAEELHGTFTISPVLGFRKVKKDNDTIKAF